MRRLIWLKSAHPEEKSLVFSQFKDALTIVGKVGDGNKGRNGSEGSPTYEAIGHRAQLQTVPNLTFCSPRFQALDANGILHVKLLGGGGTGGGQLAKAAIRRFTEEDRVSVLLLSTQKQVCVVGCQCFPCESWCYSLALQCSR